MGKKKKSVNIEIMTKQDKKTLPINTQTNQRRKKEGNSRKMNG